MVNVIGMGGKVATPDPPARRCGQLGADAGHRRAGATYTDPKGVRINAINPGATLTDRVRKRCKLEAKARKSTEDEVLAQGAGEACRCGATPARRRSRTSRCFLASDQASYVTGAIVPMDGGSNPVI